MATITKVVCDVCGKAKGEGNRWLKAYKYADDGAIMYYVTGAPSYSGTMAGGTVIDICSEKCAHDELSKTLERIRANDGVCKKDGNGGVSKDGKQTSEGETRSGEGGTAYLVTDPYTLLA